MPEATEKVEEILKSYTSMKRRIEQLRFELGHSGIISERELIESLALGVHTEGVRFSNSHLSDRTMAIALRYKDEMSRMGVETIIDVNSELCVLETEINRLEYYVSLLDKNEEAAIRLLYFERRSWPEAAEELNISKRTLFRYRKSAIEELASMYSLLSKEKR